MRLVRYRWPLWIDVALKAMLIGLLLVAVAFPDLPQFEGEAMTGRAIGHPIAVLVVSRLTIASFQPGATVLVSVSPDDLQVLMIA